MSELRQRLLPIARQPLARVGILCGFRASVRERLGALAELPSVRRNLMRLALYAAILRRTVEHWKGEAGLGAASERVLRDLHPELMYRLSAIVLVVMAMGMGIQTLGKV